MALNDQTAPEATQLNAGKRRDMAERFLAEMFIESYKAMVKWAAATGQSAQLDCGYLGQHLVSIVTGIPGTGRRGKGDDLADGSEVKTASSVGGEDIPRWNHGFTSPEKVDEWLAASNVFYVCFDEVKKRGSGLLRFRVFRVRAPLDVAYQESLRRWRDIPSRSTNYQLHPPIHGDSNLATNESGNLLLPKIYHAEVQPDGELLTLLFNPDSEEPCVLVKVGRLTAEERRRWGG